VNNTELQQQIEFFDRLMSSDGPSVIPQDTVMKQDTALQQQLDALNEIEAQLAQGLSHHCFSLIIMFRNNNNKIE
jgi:hypothetical protein